MSSVDSALTSGFGRFDVDLLRREYERQGEFVFLEDVLSPDIVAALAREVLDPALTVHRSKLPFVRKAGHIGYRALRRHAPTVCALYESPVFLGLMACVAGRPMYLKSPEDDHACAVYRYDRRGDGMSFHYDTCGCEEGASYTMIIGLVDRSSQRFIRRHRGNGEQRDERLRTAPGSMILFCGSKVLHGVSPLGTGEQRVVLSLSYATNPSMSRPRRARENLKDAILYFGPSALWQRNYSPGARAAKPLRVLVTGASSGIGAELARQYAQRGARLALFARREEKLEAVAAACRSEGASDALVLAGDTTRREEVERAVRTLDERFGGLDRAYLNAGGYGVTGSAALARARDLEWCAEGFDAASAERVMQVNYVGVLYWLDPVLRILRAQGSGTIAITGAQTADRGFPKHGPYAASKAALRALADSLRPDARRFGIRVCLIEPGCVESGLTESHCCDEMPFLQKTEPAVRRILEGVERGAPVIRFPFLGSTVSRAVALVPRFLFDRWAERQFTGERQR